MSNVKYTFSVDGKTGYGQLPNGIEFSFDAERYERIKDINLYCTYSDLSRDANYIADCNGNSLHQLLYPVRKGFEMDHVNHDILDNRGCNLRYCTHQQNQMNQPLQKNNTSGVSGVSYYPPRKKYRARVKICQHDIHLGYYDTFLEAVQARNVGMECMFGEFGCYNDVPPAPKWIRKKVIKQCKRFAELSVCRAFLISQGKAG